MKIKLNNYKVQRLSAILNLNMVFSQYFINFIYMLISVEYVNGLLYKANLPSYLDRFWTRVVNLGVVPVNLRRKYVEILFHIGGNWVFFDFMRNTH